jgi:hypothetical protein
MSAARVPKVIRARVVFSPHTTAADAEFVATNLREFRPHFFAPAEPAKPREQIQRVVEHWRQLVRGEKTEKRGGRFSDYRNALLAHLQEHHQRFGGPEIFLVEHHPREEAELLERLHQRSLKSEQVAWKHFWSGDLDAAVAQMRDVLVTHCRGVKIRAESIKRGLAGLYEHIQEQHEIPAEDEIRVMVQLSGAYFYPFQDARRWLRVPHHAGPRLELEYSTRKPLLTNTRVKMIRAMLQEPYLPRSSPELTDENMAKIFVEDALEEELKPEIPDTNRRLSECRRRASRMSLEDIRRFALEHAQAK